MSDPTLIDIPDFALVVLIGATGSGKSHFARRWFNPTEVISSDAARGMVADDETDQSVSNDAFELVNVIAGKRLKHRRLAVIDATNVRTADRKQWVELARRWHALPVAIVLDPGVAVCIERNKARPDRNFGPGVPQRMTEEIRRGVGGLQREGFRQVWRLSSVEAIESASIERRPLWTDRRSEPGPFDIIGDVHGCADELGTLLEKLGYRMTPDGLRHPDARKLIFVGDLVDRGPNTPEALRVVMDAVDQGTALVVQGNHDQKLYRWMEGRKVTVSHGLQDSIDQLSAQPEEFRLRVKSFLDELRSHYWLDGGRLAVAHAGLKEEMIGRGSGVVRDFALFGETTGETDEFGLPVRADWAANYRGKTAVVYGHTPVVEPEWINNTICIDTGCVFGGKLTALRWPERELVSVPAERTYAEPVRPLKAATLTGQASADQLLDYADVSGRRWIETALHKRIAIAEENAAAALEVMSRFAIAPQWLIYLPPTMSPVETSPLPGWLERPEQAFEFYRERGQKTVVLEEKHMGSRAVIAVCADEEAARRRFGIVSGESGALWTRTGRAFFSDTAMSRAVLDRLRQAVSQAGLWKELATDWLLIDAEVMPWSVKASALIEQQYEPVAVAAEAGLTAARDAAQLATSRGVPANEALGHLEDRLSRVRNLAATWRPFSWAVTNVDDLKIAPFHVLASEGAAHFDKDHLWHLAMAEKIATSGAPFMNTTARRVDLADAAACDEAVAWWEELTGSGGEGIVVKPLTFVAEGSKGPIQPAVKVRGRQYLRMIYGPEYDMPANLERLKQRGLSSKRALALKEFALGHEALKRFAAREPLRRVHECVFGILALESEPIDPRL
jgi:protein phosphatase